MNVSILLVLVGLVTMPVDCAYTGLSARSQLTWPGAKRTYARVGLCEEMLQRPFAYTTNTHPYPPLAYRKHPM